ncbi:MAG: type II secretion system ATPase GspE [Candidatus Omnitrophica bacterium]|nr:type II secretion system ATPase GspE [Candidatus Omnitrophota bacterium]
MAKKQEIADLLLKENLITQEQLDQATIETRRTGLSIIKALEKLKFISEESIAEVRAKALGVPYMDLGEYVIDSELTKLIPEKLAKKYKMVPLFKVGTSLTVAMFNPQDIVALDQARKMSQMDAIDPVVASETGIQKILDIYYGGSSTVDEIVDSIDTERISVKDDKDLAEIAEEAPVVKLVSLIISKAVKERASDIHIEPEAKTLLVRNRVDGVLRESHNLPKALNRALTSRIKILANLDIAENRRPQDGKIRLKIENRDIDIRVSTFPTVHGENVVMRILDKSSVVLGLKDLGLSNESLEALNKLIHRPNGIILVTGPTGSGKTTTLYAALTTINSIDKNIITIEDPVEYELPLIRQTQVNSKIGVTFAEGLRAILRQDPDVIMVGEIRDKETAEIAIRASLTGHLVLSTLHTNDAVSSLTRLVDMGVEPFLVSSSVIGVIAQRLVRVICDKCKEEYKPSESILKDLGVKIKNLFYRGKGCKKCDNTGFMGRTGIYEFFTINDEIRNMVNEKQSADKILERAVASGWIKTLSEDGLEKVSQGITTAEEVLKVTKVK